MYTPEFFIDSFQNTKKAFTDAVIKDATLNKAAHAYIDAQTAFAKVLVTNTTEIGRYAAGQVSSVLFAKKGCAA
jgi:hypothetical protein